MPVRELDCQTPLASRHNFARVQARTQRDGVEPLDAPQHAPQHLAVRAAALAAEREQAGSADDVVEVQTLSCRASMAGEDLARKSRPLVDHPERLFDQVKERVVAVEGKAVGCKDELLDPPHGEATTRAGAPRPGRQRRTGGVGSYSACIS